MVISIITLCIYFLLHFIPKYIEKKTFFYFLMSVCDVFWFLVMSTKQTKNLEIGLIQSLDCMQFSAHSLGYCFFFFIVYLNITSNTKKTLNQILFHPISSNSNNRLMWKLLTSTVRCDSSPDWGHHSSQYCHCLSCTCYHWSPRRCRGWWGTPSC